MESVEASILHSWPLDLWSGSTSVVGVSGGPDSVALLHALRAVSNRQAPLVVAHIDHGLRGIESDGDREFVHELAHRWGMPCETVRLTEERLTEENAVSARGIKEMKSSEEALRKVRHRHLQRIAVRYGAQWIATAHHADDVIETMLHRLLRGSGPRGLASIPLTRKLASNLTLVHPLLSVSRSQIMQYIEANRLEFRTDRSNASEAYTRNRIRHQLLPYLREFSETSDVDRRLWQATQQVREEHEYVEESARQWLETARVSEDVGSVEFAAQAFEDVAWCVVREGLVAIWHDLSWPLQGVTAKHWDKLRSFLQPTDPGPHPRRMQLPGQIDVTMRRGIVRFFRNDSDTD
jgi:tRNA(Ile)-lysidine synthase